MLQLDPILNLFIGLALTFGSFSLLTTALVEAVASVLRLRAHTLVAGLQTLLNDKDLSGYARDVLDHAAVNPLSAGKADGNARPVLPTYIEPTHFAAALTEVLVMQAKAKGAAADLQAAIDAVPDRQLRPFLQGLYDRADSQVDRFRAGLAAWFDTAMDRVSGDYKRQVQYWNFGIATLLAVAMNVDALHIAQQLWVQPNLGRAVAGALPAGGAAMTPDQYREMYDLWRGSFPFGWPVPGFDWPKLPLMIAGWLITASSTLLGAPFWFDTLQRVARIRSSGPSPSEAAAARGGADGKAVVSAGLQVGMAAQPPAGG